ncbi:hypothetical protein MCOR02_012452 [Pyricularia oryzae]|nr:hypothetical protein MCOR02_012452 [Pyricularia oryzae]
MKFTIATSILAAIPLASAHYTLAGSCTTEPASGGTGTPGPAQVYVSLAPGSVKTYDGSGDWIKVHQSLLCKDPLVARDLQYDGWCMYGENKIEFEVPETLPDGEYLVRAEHIAIHGAHDGKAEFYYSCAQVRIQGSNATALPTGAETAKIPGVYKTDDAAINFSVWGGKTSYPLIPGIAVARAVHSGTSPAPVPAVSAAAASSSSSTAAASTAAATTPAATAPASTLATSVVASSTAATTTATTAEAVTTATSTASTLPATEPKPTEPAGPACKGGHRGRRHRFRGPFRG